MFDFVERFNLIDQSSPFLFRNAFPQTPEWDVFESHLSQAKNAGLAREYSKDLYLIFMGDKTSEYYFSLYKGLQYFSENLSKIFGNQFVEEPNFVVSKSLEGITGFQKHSESPKVFHWNCVGESKWTVWTKEENIKYDFFLEPGDVIFVPSFLPHQVESLTEHRAAIVYDVDFSAK